MLRHLVKNGLLVLALLSSTTAFADYQTAQVPNIVAPMESLTEMDMQLSALERPDWDILSVSAQRSVIRHSLRELTRSQRNEAIWRGLSEYDVGWQTLDPDTQRHILIDVLSYRELITLRSPAT